MSVPPANVDQHTICLLPWLDVGERVSFGRITLDRFDRVKPELAEPLAETAERIVGGFRDLRGEPVEASMCWFSDREPTAEIAEAEADSIRDHILVAMIAAIAENTYFSHHPQVNATHFQRVHQNFVPGTDTLALFFRRRDGGMWSAGWRVDELRFGMPGAANGRATPRWKQAFLDALGSSVGAEDELSVRILDSALWFFQGCEMDEHERHAEDVVFLVSALEQLCGTTGRRQHTQLSRSLVDTLGERWDDDAKRSVRRWITEAYKKRSEIHGARTGAERWPYWAHALLAATAYCLMTKASLADAGSYELDDDDQAEVEAFPARVECVVGNPEDEDAQDAAACWHGAARSAGMRIATRRALADLEQ